jgi:hypothetical protein
VSALILVLVALFVLVRIRVIKLPARLKRLALMAAVILAALVLSGKVGEGTARSTAPTHTFEIPGGTS